MYVKTQWVNNTTPINDTNLNKIEQGIYDNSLVVDAVTNTLNPTDTETYKTAELTEGQITDVIGVNDIIIKGQTSQDGTPTPSAPVDVNVVSGSNVINTSNKSGNLFNYDKWLENKTNFDTSDFKITKDCIVSIVPTRNDTDTLTPPMPTNPTASDIKTLQWMSFPVESNTDYTIILKNENLCTMQIVRFFYRENYSYINVAQSNFSSQYAVYTFKTTADTKFVSFRFDNESYSTTAKSLKISEIQLLKGIYTTSTIPAYEPHQGKELPLDLPVENLLNLTGVPTNTAREVTLTNLGNNMFKVSALGNRTQSWIYNYSMSIPSEWLGKTLTLSAKILSGTFGSTTNIGFKSSTGDVFVSLLNSSNTTTITQSMIDSAINFQFFSSNRDFVDAIIGIQIEEGSKANAYTPYGTEPIELCKIGDYQDYFYKSGSKWYLHKEIGKTIFNGSETWSYSSGNSVFYTDLLVTLSKPNTILFCNRFLKIDNATSYANMNTGEIKYDGGGSRRIIIKYTDVTSAADFKTWLASNNTTVYYPLETATDTEITDTILISQLEAIYNAPLYEETNITQTNNDLPMVLDITACKDNINGIKAFIRK